MYMRSLVRGSSNMIRDLFSRYVLRWVQSVITSQRGSKDKEIRSLRTFCILLRVLVGRLGVRYKER